MVLSWIIGASFYVVVFGVADDRHRPLGMVEIDHDFQVTRRRGRRLVHDRDLFFLGAALERVTQAEEPGGDDSACRRAVKAIDRSMGRVTPFDFAVVDTLDVFGFVPTDVLHGPTVCRITARSNAAVPPAPRPSLPMDSQGVYR
jgi:hypothetical protein